jgi:hypothetical protein
VRELEENLINCCDPI